MQWQGLTVSDRGLKRLPPQGSLLPAQPSQSGSLANDETRWPMERQGDQGYLHLISADSDLTELTLTGGTQEAAQDEILDDGASIVLKAQRLPWAVAPEIETPTKVVIFESTMPTTAVAPEILPRL